MQVNSFARSLKKGSFQLVGLNQDSDRAKEPWAWETQRQMALSLSQT